MTVMAEDGEVIQTVGESAILNGNQVQAKEMAISDALRKAVEQVVGMLVDSRTDTKNYQLIQDTIRVKSTGYVSKYEVLGTKIEGDILKVTVQATIKKDALRQDVDALKLTILEAGKPRVMVIISDKNNNSIASQVTESEISRVLLNNGFPLVDQNKFTQDSLIGQAIAGDNQASSRLASKYDADILVIAKTSKESVTVYDGFFNCRALLEIQVLRVNSGQTLVVNSYSDNGVDIVENSAYKKAITKISSKMAEYLKGELGKQLIESNRSISISVHGISYSELQLIQRHLKETPAVNNVFLRGFSEGQAKLDVDTGLLANQLADQIMTWDDLHLEITSLADSKIELKK
jgi:hypothetical protein